MATTTRWQPGNYPQTRRSDHVDTYKSKKDGEVAIADPYQWLEVNSKETEEWIDAQQAVTQAYLEQTDDRDKLKAELTKNWNYAKFSAPSLKRDGKWYWYYNSGLLAQSVIYRSKDGNLPSFEVDGPTGPEDAGEVFFDPNLLSDDGTAALATTAFSRCGQYFAYGVSLSGSDFFTIYIRPSTSPFNTKPANGLSDPVGRFPEVIRYVKFSSICWTHDSKGFFYQRFPERPEHGALDSDAAGKETTKDKNAMVYYHRLGTEQSEDVLIHHDPENPTHLFSVGISEIDGRFLELYVSKDTSPTNKLWVADLEGQKIGPKLEWHKVADDFEASYAVTANDDRTFYAITNRNASRKKVIKFDLPSSVQTAPLEFKEFIPEDPKGGILEDFGPVNGETFLAHYTRDVLDKLYLVNASGEFIHEIDPDFVGTLSPSFRRDQSFFFVTYAGFNNPGIIKRFDFPEKKGSGPADASWRTWRKTFLKGLVPEDFSAEQVWYESKDGTKVPMFVVRHKDTPMDGTAPVIQYGYGGFSVTINPFFSVGMLTFVKAYGGVVAVPGIRGGAELGEDWHKAGVRENRPKVYEDFICATEYLVKNKIGASGKVAINGGSNGGTLVAACVNRAPEGTFGAAVAEVGVMDLLKFNQFTIGYAWTSDYGDPSVPEDFDFIRNYSPLHNIPQDRVLPPMILLTADHDDRVVPLHSFKHAATLQHLAPQNPHPLLIRIDKKAGHGAGKSTEKRIQDQADKWAFVAQAMGLGRLRATL